MDRPAEWRAVPDDVADVEPRAARDQEAHHGLMSAEDGLMQRRAMRMVGWRIEAVRIVDMSTSNSWAEFAGLFRSTRQAFLDHERSKAELKALMPEDAKEAIGHGKRPNQRGSAET